MFVPKAKQVWVFSHRFLQFTHWYLCFENPLIPRFFSSLSMNTFLPSDHYPKCAKVLDNKRLGKQRLEVYQILRTLTGYTKGWAHHPAVKMWNGCKNSLVLYGNCMCNEWKLRKFKDTLHEKIWEFFDYEDQPLRHPDWLGDERLHASHRSNLLRKFPAHYQQFGWTEPDDMQYWWPTKLEFPWDWIPQSINTKKFLKF